MAQRKECMEPGCTRLKKKGAHRCSWHWLEKQPIDRQVKAAQWRLQRAQARPGFEHRARVPKAEWPAGGRWCAGCQSFVPLHYTRDSRCRACASQAAYASHVRRTYEITDEEYQQLLEWQGGRCYVCQRVPGKRRLAVDHDHRTNAVRGLLCASDDWGCNKTLALPLNDVEAARRLLAYVEMSPLERMRAGEPPMETAQPSSTPEWLQRGVDLGS
jgi:hypothetical protein